MSWKFWEKSPRKRLEQLLHAGSEAMGVGDLEGALTRFEQLVRDAVAARDPTMEAAGRQRRGVVKDTPGDSVAAGDHAAARPAEHALRARLAELLARPV